MPDLGTLSVRAMKEDLLSSEAWARVISEAVQIPIDIIWVRGGDIYGARRAAVEALLQVAASFAVHNIEYLDEDYEVQNDVLRDDLDMFTNYARDCLAHQMAAHSMMPAPDMIPAND